MRAEVPKGSHYEKNKPVPVCFIDPRTVGAGQVLRVLLSMSHHPQRPGTAFAGRSSNAEDASIMAANPAGIALLKERQVTLGSAVVMPKGDFKGSSKNTFRNPANGQPVTIPRSSTNDEFLSTTAIPFGYFSMPIDDQFTFGFGVYAPFGSSTNYSDDWAGRYLADATDLTVINFQPTVAYQFFGSALGGCWSVCYSY